MSKSRTYSRAFLGIPIGKYRDTFDNSALVNFAFKSKTPGNLLLLTSRSRIAGFPSQLSSALCICIFKTQITY